MATVRFDEKLLCNSIFSEDNDEENDLTFIESSDWIVEGKYQYQEFIFHHDGKFYRAFATRSGSPFTDYHYEYDCDCDEVERKEVTKVEWVKK